MAHPTLLRRTGATWTLIASGLALGLLLVMSGMARAGELMVRNDEAKLVRLTEPATDIIVGNPSIADVAIHSSQLLVVTGKTFGVTNLIVLNNKRQVILNKTLVVKSNGTRLVNLQRGSKRQSYACTPECRSILMIGDASDYAGEVKSAADSKIQLAREAARSGPTGQ